MLVAVMVSSVRRFCADPRVRIAVVQSVLSLQQVTLVLSGLAQQEGLFKVTL